MIELQPLKPYLTKSEIETIRRFIERHRSFLLTTHVNPDGDALGSELSMYFLLKHFGKEAFILNHSPVPELYQFLNEGNLIKTYNREEHREALQNVDACFVLDIGDWERLSSVGEDLHRIREKSGKPEVLCLDHHPPEKKIGDLDIIHTNASSTAEMMYFLFRAFDIPISPLVGEALYTGILTDTGSFRFSNTTFFSHHITGHLLQLGVDHRKIYKQVYENEPLSKMKLLAHLIENLNFACDQKIVWYSISRKLLKRLKLRPDEVEGISDFPRRISGVEVSVLFMEENPTKTKISLRSTGSIPINGFAQQFGGGGHPYASGAVVSLPLEEAERLVIEKLQNYCYASLPSKS